MQPILIFRHAPHEVRATSPTISTAAGSRTAWIRIDQGDPIPTSLDGAPGLVFMARADERQRPAAVDPQGLALIRQAVATDIPVLGHCLGGQLISKALGGVITKAR